MQIKVLDGTGETWAEHDAVQGLWRCLTFEAVNSRCGKAGVERRSSAYAPSIS